MSKLQELQDEIGLLDADLVQVQGKAGSLQDTSEAEQTVLAGHNALVESLHLRLLESDPAHPSRPGVLL